jgi:hypothetical protein
MGVNRLTSLLIGLFLLGGAPSAQACLWDSDTLLQERLSNPKMATAVFDEPRKPDVGRLQGRITTLRAAPRESDPAWWNDLAGAHLRLGELQTAVALLEPAARRFPNDYGVHANLGTAYHLLKRYPEAEREIARDLELNPDAHFGLERYHLALLQYLVRDPAYRARHVYVDEWTVPFLTGQVPFWNTPQELLPRSARNTYTPEPAFDGTRPRNWAQQLAYVRKEVAKAKNEPQGVREQYAQKLQSVVARGDRPPSYRYRWDLARDPKFTEGVLYMASLNREEPAAWVMLGIASLKNSDLNLSAAAFRQAIDLGSPQRENLERYLEEIRRHQQTARTSRGPIRTRAPLARFGVTIALGILILVLLYRKFRRARHRSQLRDAGSAS